jgi:hypothetical protein
MTLYNPVTIPPSCAAIAEIYGESPTGWYWMPVGETGQEILARSKLTKEIIEESIKKGAQAVLE